MAKSAPRPAPDGAERRIEYLPLSALKPAARNPKSHDIGQIATSIGRFGYVDPLILDERTQRLIAGHGRVETVSELHKRGQTPPEGVRVGQGGEWLLPVVLGWASRTDDDAQAYLLASNQLTSVGGWDDAQLVEVLQDLASKDALDGTGFDGGDLDALLAQVQPPAGPAPGEDEVPDEPQGEPWVQQGDLFALGDHRILCGDCRHAPDVARLLDGRRINVCVTSPPYAAQREYDKASGFKPIAPDDYGAWFEAVQANIAEHLAPDGSYFLNIKEHCEDGQRVLYVKDLTLAHVRAWGWRFVDEFCWVKTAVPGSWPNRFRNAWEPVLHWSRSVAIKMRPDAVAHASDRAVSGGGGSPRTKGGAWGIPDDWAREGGTALPSNVLEIGTGGSSSVHAAAFPVALPEFFIKAFSDSRDAVFDPFMGSGSTLIAAEKTGRVAYGTELSARYTQVILERWQKFTGRKAEKLAGA